MNNDKRIRRKKRLQQKKKRQQSYGQKKRLTESQRQKGKCIRWIEPEGKNHILFVGGNSNGTICDSHTTEKQIDYLRSKESLLWRNDRLVAIDEIIIEARNPVSMEQHKAEYGEVLPPFLFAYKAMHNIHPEELKNDFHELYLSEIQQMFLLDYIRLDREMRCNNKTPMADRPPVAVVTIENDSIARLEFYKGHNVLTKQVDLRSRSLSEQNIPNSFTDELGYDVAKNEYWIAGIGGIKLSEFNDMVELAHDAMLCDYCKISFDPYRAGR